VSRFGRRWTLPDIGHAPFGPGEWQTLTRRLAQSTKINQYDWFQAS
jgi:hypothetical protein